MSQTLELDRVHNELCISLDEKQREGALRAAFYAGALETVSQILSANGTESIKNGIIQSAQNYADKHK